MLKNQVFGRSGGVSASSSDTEPESDGETVVIDSLETADSSESTDGTGTDSPGAADGDIPDVSGAADGMGTDASGSMDAGTEDAWIIEEIRTDDAQTLELNADGEWLVESVTLEDADELNAPSDAETGDFTVTGGTYGTDYTFDENTGTLTFSGTLPEGSTGERNYTVSGTGTETTDKIIVGEGFAGTITIENVKIDASQNSDGCAFEVHKTANLTVKLVGENVLQSDWQRAGLEFCNAEEGGGHLTITADSDGAGRLEAIGIYEGAGIGGRSGAAGNNITISGGTVSAGSFDGAGIGGGNKAAGSNIEISGGTVTAESADGAGIGGGWNAVGSDIIISGGTVTATSGLGTGIGGGMNAAGSNIEISGGTVAAPRYTFSKSRIPTERRCLLMEKNGSP